MSDNPITPLAGVRRKKVRKGTRSCWECKKKKTKCTYQSDDQSICVGCIDKGTRCISQVYVDNPAPPEPMNGLLDQRLERVENLLEKFMEKVSRVAEDNRPNDDLADILPVSSAPTTANASQSPITSSFDDAQRGQTGINNITSPQQSLSIPKPSIITKEDEEHMAGKMGTLRRRLAEMMPCQEDVDYLLDLSYGWWLIQRHMMPHLLEILKHDLTAPFNVWTVSNGHPIIIARLLLCVAICIQQLPPSIDLQRLQIKLPLQEVMENIITSVTAMVTSDDELTGSLEGIECLILQAIYQVNAGNFRRSWLGFRRAISVAQLMGLHRVSLNESQKALDSGRSRCHHMWLRIVQSERYLSLILSVPSATGSSSFSINDIALWLSAEDHYNIHLCHIAGLILARNQGSSLHSFSITQEITKKLDLLAVERPKVWCDAPTAVMNGRTQEAVSHFERSMCQIWHFELGMLTHLPFMLRASTDRQYHQSRISCLSASRGLIRRWVHIRETQETNLFSNLTDFQAFTATITLILGLLGSMYTTADAVLLEERYEDMRLVETVVEILERLKQHGTGVHMVNQSISIIHTLQSILHNDGKSPDNLRLEIPHFGIISVARSGAVQSLEGERIVGANPRSNVYSMDVGQPISVERFNSSPLAAVIEPTWTRSPVPTSQMYLAANSDGGAINGNGLWMDNTILNFTSTQFPIFEESKMDNNIEWPFLEGDVIFFDGLLNTDVEGNWPW